ncbi:eukaryotic translation initiation factor 3 subunit 6 [Lactarius deliciosus]|nr:eukaryotic translation initiation factor 3 subunit 6 [Lactarius deliciosus]
MSALQCEPENPDVARALRQDKNQNLAYLKDNYDLTLEQITALYNLGKFQYVRELFGRHVLSIDTDLNTSAHWGKLASNTLTGKWDVTPEELSTFRETLVVRAGATPLSGAAAQPQRHAEPLATPHSRAGLVHLSLFVYFNYPAGRTLLLKTFLVLAYLNTIQSAVPWVLRYLAVAAVLSRRAQASGGTAPVSSRVRHAIREVVKSCTSTRTVTKFLKELYVEFDFVARAAGYMTGFGMPAYLPSPSLTTVTSAQLNLSPDKGEKWIVNLIRDTRLAADAKIDLEKNVIEIHRPALPIYRSALGAALSRTGQQLAQEQPATVEGAQ